MKNPCARPLLSFLAVMALGGSATVANASTITYSFTGATLGSFQEDSSRTYDSDTGYVYSPAYGTAYNASTGSVTFKLDVDRYVDQQPAPDHAYFSEEPPATPWLTSTSTVSGPQFSRTLTTFGEVSSGLWGITAEANEFGVGFLNLFDLLLSRYEVVEDESGRIISSRYQRVYNSMILRGGIMFGFVDGKEVPVGISHMDDGFFVQHHEERFADYSYDDLGMQTHLSLVTTYFRTELPIESWDISIRQVPEPTSLLLVSLGMTALGLCRRKAGVFHRPAR